MGDLHFSQGDGEITFCGAIEMAGWIHLHVDLIKGGMAKYNMQQAMFKVSPVDPHYSDYLVFEGIGVGAVGWVAGLVTAFPAETVAIHRLLGAGRRDEALEIYRWFRPLLDLDVSTYLVQNIKLAEVLAIGSNDRVRMPRMPLQGERRRAVERIVRDAIASRPELPGLGG